MLHIFPVITLSDTEQTVANECLSNPAVKKYLHSLAYYNAQDIVLGVPADNEAAESYLRRQAVVKGRLEALETLLSIQPLPKTI